MEMASTGNRKGKVDPEIHKLKAIAQERRMTVFELYESVKGVLFDPNGKKISEEAFRSRYNRGNEPKWLIDSVNNSFINGATVGRFLVATGLGKLKIVGGVGAGGVPSNNMDEQELYVPIEFSNEAWRGMVVENDARSLMPFIQPGDTVVLKPTSTPMLRKFMVVQDARDPNTLYVKQVLHVDGAFVFVNTNKDVEPIDMVGLILVGLVVGVISADMRLKIGPNESGISPEYFEEQLRGRLP
jgi:hypothetical protein